MKYVEWWLCSECFGVAPSHEWGGTDSTAICPHCNFEHRDDESTYVDARPTEIEIYQVRREAMRDG